MENKKVLNLYAGIGGNRKYWKNVDVTAVEFEAEIAAIYQGLFPEDKVIIGDAHEYLLRHFAEFDFIWASPPCPSHSCVRKMGCSPGKNKTEAQNKPIYPDMKLYQEIIFLQGYFKGKFCVENVMPYYKPLIEAKKIERHLLWTNFPLNKVTMPKFKGHNDSIDDFKKSVGVDLTKYKLSKDAKTIYRNCVNPELGKYVLESAFEKKQEVLL